LESERPLLIATDAPSMHALARALDAELALLPSLDAPGTFEAWRDELSSGAQRERLVVSIWNDAPRQAPLLDLDESSWEARFERPYLLWNLALGAASRRCRDGGSIVGLVQTPAALDSPGWTPEMSIADGVVALVRSVAAAEGSRGIRANTVTTPVRLIEGDVIAPPPPLATFPGRLDDEVAGAVRLLLSPDARGLTGRVLSADCGRSLA
jgi:NAD(P)-dependent dehydrogenase (short-subunit alcohol dehydrogenase family)